jgi:hypothetical protein
LIRIIAVTIWGSPAASIGPMLVYRTRDCNGYVAGLHIANQFKHA